MNCLKPVGNYSPETYENVKIAALTITTAITTIVLLGSLLAICAQQGLPMGVINTMQGHIGTQLTYVACGASVFGAVLNTGFVVALTRNFLNKRDPLPEVQECKAEIPQGKESLPEVQEYTEEELKKVAPHFILDNLKAEIPQGEAKVYKNMRVTLNPELGKSAFCLMRSTGKPKIFTTEDARTLFVQQLKGFVNVDQIEYLQIQTSGLEDYRPKCNNLYRRAEGTAQRDEEESFQIYAVFTQEESFYFTTEDAREAHIKSHLKGYCDQEEYKPKYPKEYRLAKGKNTYALFTMESPFYFNSENERQAYINKNLQGYLDSNEIEKELRKKAPAKDSMPHEGSVRPYDFECQGTTLYAFTIKVEGRVRHSYSYSEEQRNEKCEESLLLNYKVLEDRFLQELKDKAIELQDGNYYLFEIHHQDRWKVCTGAVLQEKKVTFLYLQNASEVQTNPLLKDKNRITEKKE